VYLYTKTGLQEFLENLLFGEETSVHQRSILLVDIMNAIGFSKNERDIHRHSMHLHNFLMNMFRTSGKCMHTITGSTGEGMCGGIYSNQIHHDHGLLLTIRKIKLYTPLTNYILNPPLLLLLDNGDYEASFLWKKMTTFQDMSNYH
jgi:hypothetical protein